MHSSAHTRFILALLLFIARSSLAQEVPISRGELAVAPLPPANISAAVVAVSDAEVRLAVTGDQWPNAGDKVDFYFKIPGLDDEVAVGSGTVLSADEKTVTAKFETGTGKPQPGHLAHIHSAAPRKAGAPSPAPGTQPAPTVQQGASPYISWLGLITDRVPIEMIEALHLRPRSGAQVIGVLPGGPAALAGLQKDDIISEIDGEILRDEGDLLRLSQTRQPGTKVAFTITRNLHFYVKEVTYASRPSEEAFNEKYRAAAEAGDAAAQWAYGIRLIGGTGQPVDAAGGMTWLARAAEQNLRKAQVSLAQIYNAKNGDADAQAKAIEWFRRAAALGDAPSQNTLGLHYLRLKNYPQAVDHFRMAAEQGEPQSEELYGRALLNGEGVTASYPEGMKWLTLAAATGRPSALFNLGNVQIVGVATKRDTTAGLKNLHAAADANHIDAMRTLADIYAKGEIVKKNPATSRQWHQKAEAQAAAVAARNAAAATPPPAPVAPLPASPPPMTTPPPRAQPIVETTTNNPGAFAGTFKGEVTLMSGSNNGSPVAGGGPCPATFTLRLHPSGTIWGLDISSDRSKPNASQFDGHWNLKASGNVLSSGYDLPAGSQAVSIEVIGNEIKGTISSQSKRDGAVTRSSSHALRATRAQP